MRRAAKVDDNHAEIRAAFRSLGAEVVDCSHVGDGFPDLLVGWRGRVLMVEVKDSRKPPSARKLTPAQTVFHVEWQRVGCKVHVITNVDEALALLGARAA
jgi:Holliday junction resolvase